MGCHWVARSGAPTVTAHGSASSGFPSRGKARVLTTTGYSPAPIPSTERGASFSGHHGSATASAPYDKRRLGPGRAVNVLRRPPGQSCSGQSYWSPKATRSWGVGFIGILLG